MLSYLNFKILFRNMLYRNKKITKFGNYKVSFSEGKTSIGKTSMLDTFIIHDIRHRSHFKTDLSSLEKFMVWQTVTVIFTKFLPPPKIILYHPNINIPIPEVPKLSGNYPICLSVLEDNLIRGS